MTLHLETTAERVPGSARYSFRNWSYEFRCPVCGRTKRYNTNFLGRREVKCVGADKFTLTRREA